MQPSAALTELQARPWSVDFHQALWRIEAAFPHLPRAGHAPSPRLEPALFAQFHPLEDALAAMGVVVWPMIELEADDALASAAHLAAADPRVEKVCIWTPDKDLAQCVDGDRVVQIHRRTNLILNAEAVEKKFGVPPVRIPDFLALVGDSADGYPGIDGIGEAGALLGEVEMPVGLEVLGITDGYVVGIYRDELDVQQVRLHEVKRVAAHER